ncbi:MAG TPA: ribosome small subunit-dependent GTPase A [Methylibium sp.]|uniref:ribosome small subunit-dependent GTPase A n=1 Tax=Methylibium sp. TaxID=2067992 RepID=UPI002DBCE99B|nr:ribosome small subunit-dependent GTPase A [Methylibium sp.]HEU4457566.1 ribosome small subunit-dependent GTPase A [Methylibium sp.]
MAAGIAIVVAGHGRHYLVEDAQGRRHLGHPRGKKSEAVVGDRVRFEVTGDASAVIEAIEPRRNLLFRQDAWKTKAFAANLDRLLVWLAVDPSFGESQLARALIAAESAGIATTVVLNKTDLAGHAEQAARLGPYRAMGYEVVELSLKTRRDAAQERLAPLLKGATTLVLGPSGAGKSSLINALLPDAGAQVGEISRALNSGRHTTTSSQWYWLDREHGSALIDSPGFQSFGLQHVEPASLVACMPDLRAHAGDCRFYNCTHRREPGCAVVSAVQQGAISESRWRIYRELLGEHDATRDEGPRRA